MSNSTPKINAELQAAAIATLKNLKATKGYVTSDGHVYTESGLNDMLYHCRTSEVSYWEVSTEDQVAKPVVVNIGTLVKEVNITGNPDPEAIKEAFVEVLVNAVSDADLSKMKEAANATDTLDADLKLLIGVPVETLVVKNNKEQLVSIANRLNIVLGQGEADVKLTYAQAIYNALNPTV